MTSITTSDGLRLDDTESVIEKDGHAANIEQWREFNRVMLAFLKRLGA